MAVDAVAEFLQAARYDRDGGGRGAGNAGCCRAPAQGHHLCGGCGQVVTGTTVAQAIGVLLSPLLTRLYAPEAFGLLAVLRRLPASSAWWPAYATNLRLCCLKPMREAANLLGVSLLATVVITLFTIPVVTLGEPFLLRLLRGS